MNHYFKDNEDFKSNEKIIKYQYESHDFIFHTDVGVFSRGEVDYGSKLLIDNIKNPAEKILDLGCGYGCIGIILYRVHNIEVVFSDINGRAVELTRKNLSLNNIKAEVIKSDGFADIHENFGTITLNPPIHAGKKVIFRLYEDIFHALNIGGKLYTVIQRKHGAESHRKKLSEIYGNCTEVYGKKGFFVFSAEHSILAT